MLGRHEKILLLNKTLLLTVAKIRGTSAVSLTTARDRVIIRTLMEVLINNWETLYPGRPTNTSPVNLIVKRTKKLSNVARWIGINAKPASNFRDLQKCHQRFLAAIESYRVKGDTKNTTTRGRTNLIDLSRIGRAMPLPNRTALQEAIEGHYDTYLSVNPYDTSVDKKEKNKKMFKFFLNFFERRKKRFPRFDCAIPMTQGGCLGYTRVQGGNA